MKIKTLSAALACALPFTGTFAAALDRSGQSIAAFLQPGNYAEVGVSILDPDVSGKEAGTSETRRNVSDMADDYTFANAAFKFQPTKQFSFGVIYDQPFGASATYSGNNIFVSDASKTILPTATLNALGQATIAKNVADLLPGYTQAALSANLTNAVNATVTQQAQALASKYPAGTPLAAIEAGIRADANAMKLITDGATTAIAERTKDAVTQQVTAQTRQTIADVNALLGQGATKVNVDTHAISLIGGFQPTENWNIYAGAVYQTIEGEVNLRGQAYSLYNGYDLSLSKDDAWGWLAGIAYQIPEIALKASLTYRSEIDYDINGVENLSVLNNPEKLAPVLAGVLGVDTVTAAATINGINKAKGTTAITTPQSINLDLQSGIMENTVAFANIRWVDWSNFNIRPFKFGLVSDIVGKLPQIARPNGFNLVEYDKDQWSVTTGIGRKLNDKWSASAAVGWDSGSGNPITTLGPTEGYWNVGLGFQYSPAPEYFVAGGVKYFWLGDAKAQTGAQAGGEQIVAEFENNNAIAYGLKMGYRF